MTIAQIFATLGIVCLIGGFMLFFRSDPIRGKYSGEPNKKLQLWAGVVTLLGVLLGFIALSIALTNYHKSKIDCHESGGTYQADVCIREDE